MESFFFLDKLNSRKLTWLNALWGTASTSRETSAKFMGGKRKSDRRWIAKILKRYDNKQVDQDSDQKW